MKKKKIKTPINESVCLSAPPPWAQAKTKQAAWNDGKQHGWEQGYKTCKHDLDLESKRLAIEERKQQLDIVRNIAQAGSVICESMSKALLSYDKNL